MATLIGKVKSLNVTVHGGAAAPFTGARTARVTKNFNTVFDYDPDSDTPDAYQGNVSKRLEITLRDRDLAIALMATPCVDTLTLVMAVPLMACDGSTEAAASCTVTGTNLVVDGDIEPAGASTENVPGEYTVAFVATRVGATKGDITVVKAGA